MSAKNELPPYFNIVPARAAKRLSQRASTARFAFAARGRTDLANRGDASDGQKRLRRFSS